MTNPLNSSHDELNRSYDRVSSTEDITEYNESDALVSRNGIGPGSLPTPEVDSQDSSQTIQFDNSTFSANLQILLYGTSTLGKVSFINEFMRKAIAGGQLDVTESATDRMKPAILDHTGNASLPRSDYNPDRPSLAIIFLPCAHAAILQHNAYLPVFIPSSEDSFEKEFEKAQEEWATYPIPAHRVVHLEGSSSSSSALFVAEDVEKLDPYHTHQAIRRTVKQEKPASWTSFLEQFNPVHAVTLFALLFIIAGFSVNSVLGVPPLKGIVVIPASPTVGKVNSSDSTALIVRTSSSISTVPAAIDRVPAVYSGGTVSTAEAGPSTAPPPKPESRNADLITDTFMTWAERMKVSKEIMVRPSTSVSARSSSIPSEPSIEPVASTSATATQESSTSALSLRFVDSISEIVLASVKALVEVVDHDMKDILLALDELMLSIHRSTKAVVEHSKNAAQIVREHFEYRNARAMGKAKELREKGKQMMVFAESTLWGVHMLKEKLTSSGYIKKAELIREKLRTRTKHAQRRAHKQKEGIKARRFTMDLRICGCMLFPLGLLLLSSAVLFPPSRAAAEQQCRLVLNDVASAPSMPTSVGLPFPNSSSPTGTATGTATASPTPSRTPFNYGTEIIRGVNLLNQDPQFSLEPWITPSIFENTNDDSIVDEYTLGLKTNFNDSLQMLQNHWDTWITEDDFAAMNAAGLNHVRDRIPLGYWSVPLPSSATNTSTSISPYIPGAWPYLLRALNWAAAYNIHVILDLHGAPGSQNGYDNSGQRTPTPQWALNPANVTRSIDTLVYIAEQIGGMIDVLELLNESAGFTSTQWADVTRSFFSDGYTAVRAAVGGGLKIMIGDAFLGVDGWEGFLTYPAQGVIMDNHEYQIFSIPELQRSFSGHLAFTCTTRSTISSFASSNIWTIIGEWSNSPTDCAMWLNGRGAGSRWDNSYNGGPANGSCNGLTGDSSTFSDDYKTFLRQYWEAQVEIGESAQGWIFWAWKVTSSPVS
ncbi:hypothetical protein D9757_002359 [Collybiopsis confluens]|uniref:glucan 1,3-beta-glucosidase n=1 Tax=Collybiopsis confluens TaxID=2823264 RepID=A0A8H5MF88_9AGAR|nr:hypothetical protein D9757_002359 [Collybiopsis confluens]